MDEILIQRSNLLKKGNLSKGNVIYWMSRDQRVDDNWALIFASQLAQEHHSSLAVVFCLVPEFLNATIRQYGFLIKGLQKVELKLRERNIPFYVITGNPIIKIPELCTQINAYQLITDFDPLKIKQFWHSEICKKINTSFIIIDAHNIVPAIIVSNKAEFGAYTMRPKIKKLLPSFLNHYPELIMPKRKQEFNLDSPVWSQIISSLKVNIEIKEVDWLLPGEDEAFKTLLNFLHTKLQNYAHQRNNPLQNVISNLSPYLHFGQISAQRIAQEALKLGVDAESTGAFLEELIIRRELADNFCFYNKFYDSFNGFPEWAQKSLNHHRNDVREFIYTQEQFEKAQTHDDLWNAAQLEMLTTGKMHGYMRMYWAKKILEWSLSPEEALQIAINLNDKYELDGRDPNGYAGCAWSIGGVHDRAWNEHPVYGKIRYMNYNGCKRKFDVNAYIRKYKS